MGPERAMARLGNMSTFLLLVGVCSLLQVQAGPMRDKIDGLAGFTHKSPHEHHHEADRAHPHEHFLEEHHDHDHHHVHDHDHHPGHRCIHDQMEQPTVVRNFLNVHNAFRVNTSSVDNEPVTPTSLQHIQRRSSRQMLDSGRTDSGATNGNAVLKSTSNGNQIDSGSATYNETACQTVASTPKGFLRMTMQESDLSGLDTVAKQTYLKNVLIPEVQRFYESTLMVVPLTSNLVIASENNPSSGTVSGTSVSVTTAQRTTGFANTDYVLYYSSIQTTTCANNPSTIGYAGAMEVNECDRPLVGYMNFCPGGISTTDVNTKDHLQQLTTGYHEVMHALGYTNRMYAYWRTAGMAARTSRDVDGVPNQGTTCIGLTSSGDTGATVSTTTTAAGVKAGTTTCAGYNIYTPDPSYFFSYTDSVLGGTRWKLKTSNVLAKAQAHFGCSTWDGVEVEDQGGSGNWGSHWEKRIFGNEFITAQSSEIDSIVSQISLAAFEDMGWWGVNYGNDQQEFTWMKNAGCDTITQKCLTNGVPINSEYFCNLTDSGPSGTKTCTYDGAAVGCCNKNPSGTEKTGLAPYYYYFGDTTTAGSDISMYADWCPTVSHFETLICSGSKMDGSPVVGGVDYTLDLGQDYSSNSKCFASTLKTDSTTITVTAGTAGCYKFQCLSTSEMLIYVFDSELQNYPATCTTAPAGQTLSVLGFDGSITCVDPADADWCGSEQSFPSLTDMSVVSGTTDLTPYLIPPFDISITSYRLNIGAAYSSLGFTPTTTSSSAMIMTFNGYEDVETVGVGGQKYDTAIATIYDTFSFKLVTTSAQERTYSIGVSRGNLTSGNNSTRTLAITLNLAYSSITDWPSFRTNITIELEKILALMAQTTFAPTAAPTVAPSTVPSQSPTVTLSPSGGTYSPSRAPTSHAPTPAPSVPPTSAPTQLTLYQITEGSIKVQFTLQYVDNTQPEPISLDATLQNLYNNKDSVMFKDYTYLKHANNYESTETFISCGDSCTNEYCNAETGICSNTGGDDDELPEWALYVIIAVAVVLGAILLFFVGKKVMEHCCTDCCARRERPLLVDPETGEDIPPRQTFQPIDRAAGKKEAAYMHLDETAVPISGAGGFSSAMDDESSDDEAAGQI